jgi:hypothetical protein
MVVSVFADSVPELYGQVVVFPSVDRFGNVVTQNGDLLGLGISAGS